MIVNPTLTAEEFKTIHNGLYRLDCAISKLEGVIRDELYAELAKAGQEIRSGLKSAYEQDDRAYTDRSAHYEAVSDEYGLTSVWSMYEVTDLYSAHPFQGVQSLVYKDHWGKAPVNVPIDGKRWLDLWRAANRAIAASGDNHHIFVEQFALKDGQLILYTGS